MNLFRAIPILLPFTLVFAQDDTGKVKLDRSKPVPARSEVIVAWQKRQDSVKTIRFAWTEQQTHPRGWLPNPRFPEREWLNIPGVLYDRNYAVSKTLVADGNKMRYSFEIDRKEEADGIRVKAEGNSRNDGLGLRRFYRYVSVFDGQAGRTSLTTFIDEDISSGGGPAPSFRHVKTNVDGQNLDTRAILMAFRPLDSAMGHLLIDRAVCNLMRTFYRGKSIFKFEESHDPSGWKTLLWVEPERDFIVSRYDVFCEQKLIVAIDIDYAEDAQWGWIPSGWRVSEMLADGTRRLVSVAKVTSYSINQPIADSEFR